MSVQEQTKSQTSPSLDSLKQQGTRRLIIRQLLGSCFEKSILWLVFYFYFCASPQFASFAIPPSVQFSVSSVGKDVDRKPQPNIIPLKSEQSVGLTGDGSDITATRRFLDGAIALAWNDVKFKPTPPPLTSMQWLWQLADAYHLTHLTPQLMEKAARSFTASDRKILAQWAAEKAKEEAGHDRLAILDIQSMGYQPDAVVGALVSPTAEALVNYFIQSASKQDPISCVGYAYTMERLALGIDENYIQQVEGLLPQSINATRCLRVHSSVGSDVEHVEETVKMVAELDFQERNQVATACYETALRCFSLSQEDYKSDRELENLLKLQLVREPFNGSMQNDYSSKTVTSLTATAIDRPSLSRDRTASSLTDRIFQSLGANGLDLQSFWPRAMPRWV
jgi:pyrroloquinoline quinone (PQQ) biosynthesis protein C